MPVLDGMEEQKIAGSNYGFSAKRIDDLGASEYTLGTVIMDVSGSVSSYKKELEKALQEIVRACRRNPRADNMMLRVVFLNQNISELHGFKPLPDCNENDYKDVIRTGGLTALYDGAYNCIEAMNQYGKQLTEQDYEVNGAVFVVTDGQDNASKATRSMVGQSLMNGVQSESLESIMPVLIGVQQPGEAISSYLQSFKDECGFQQYVEIDVADEQKLARLGNFISQSISSQSKSLGTGGGSKSLTF